MKRILISFAFVLLILSCVHHSNDKMDLAAFNVDPEKTLEYLNDIAGDNQSNPNLYFKRAEIYYQLGQFESAYEDIEKSIHLVTTNPKSYLLKGKIENKIDRPKEAIKSLLVAEKLGVRDQELYRIIASAYLNQNEIIKAKAAVERLISLQPDAMSYELQGDVLFAIGDTLQAEKSYKTAIAKNKMLKNSYTQLIGIYQTRNQQDNALELVNKYLETDSTDYDMRLQKGRLLSNLNQQDSAILIYRSIISQDSSDYQVFYELSSLFYLSNKFDSATYYAEKSLKLNSNFYQAKLMVARTLNSLRKYQESILVYESILAQDSTKNLAAQELANLQRKVAYLWQLEQQAKTKDTVKENLPPMIEKKELDNR